MALIEGVSNRSAMLIAAGLAGAWWLNSRPRRYRAGREGRSVGPRVRHSVSTTGSKPPDAVPASSIDTGKVYADPVAHRIIFENWDEGGLRKLHLADVPDGSRVRVEVFASIPTVGDWVKIGTKKYTYTKGPKGSSAVLRAITKALAAAAESGLQAVSPQASEVVGEALASLLGGIPEYAARKRLEKWAHWREGLDATRKLRSDDMLEAFDQSEICQAWRAQGIYGGGDEYLPSAPYAPDVAWLKPTQACLKGDPPQTWIEDGRLYTELHAPDAPRESRYDVWAYMLETV